MTINAKTITLISAVTANSNGEAYEWAGQGLGSLQVFGTFDTCTVTMQGSLDGGVTWTAITSQAFTAASFAPFGAANCLVRAVVSSVGASSSVSAILTPQEVI